MNTNINNLYPNTSSILAKKNPQNPWTGDNSFGRGQNLKILGGGAQAPQPGKTGSLSRKNISKIIQKTTLIKSIYRVLYILFIQKNVTFMGCSLYLLYFSYTLYVSYTFLIRHKDIFSITVWSLRVNVVTIPLQSSAIMLSILPVTSISSRNTNKPQHTRQTFQRGPRTNKKSSPNQQ